MFIGPYKGYGIEQPATAVVDYGLYLQVEPAGTAAIPRGSLMAWDTVDNTAITGIMRQTYGLRVLIHPTLAATTTPNPSRPAGFTITAIEANASAASSRTKLVVIQAYGPHGNLLADTSTAGDIVKSGHIVPCVVTQGSAGMVSGPEDNASLTDNERLNAVGFSFEVVAAAGAPGVVFKGFVNCLGAK